MANPKTGPKAFVESLDPIAKEEFRRRSCSGKKRYGSQDLAAFAQERHAEDLGENLEIYFCWFCRGFHIGHASKTGNRAKDVPSR
jgi:hypothetical protein